MSFDVNILEFPKILTQCMYYAETNKGKVLIKGLKPLTDIKLIEQAHQETTEAKRYINHDKHPSFGGVYDIDDSLKRAKIHSVLEANQFMAILAHVESATRIKREMYRLPDDLDERFVLCDYADQIILLPKLREAIQSIFDEQGRVKNDASSSLRTIRHKLETNEKKVKEQLNQVLKKDASKLTEQIVTIRYNRYVVPVKLSDKNTIKGTILDYSSSGETAYVEPESIRELQVRKMRLESEEKQEIERLFNELTLTVSTFVEDLKVNVEILALLDMIFAKGKYAFKIDAHQPKVTQQLKLIRARHPLIDPEEVISNTITFDETVKMMIITGSNTGGKTVTLKTIGLLSLMAQSGLLIPVDEHSEIRIFKQIKADIGDEQSIEQSLSTFSSHMSRIVNIINDYDDDALILLDELGSGTDPKEGASLAMSILDQLLKKNSIIIATTHYPELKAYAYTQDTIMNASVEFDEKTLKPTYRLLLRTPGESHAFLISQRLGLKQSIIDKAKDRVITQKTEVSDLIQKLKTEATRLDQEILKYHEYNESLIKKDKAHETLKQQLEEKRTKLKDQIMREQALKMKEYEAEAKQLIEDLETLKTKSFKDHELAEKKHQLKTLRQEEHAVSQTQGHAYQPGDQVYVLKYNRHAELVKQLKNKQWQVKMGVLTSVFKEDEFEYSGKPKKKKQTQKEKTVKKRVPSELDLRGLRVHEAKDELEKYLDDCALSKMPFASIIHGFGTLAVRTMVKEVLNQHPLVKSHRDGEGNEGGKGVTIAYF